MLPFWSWVVIVTMNHPPHHYPFNKFFIHANSVRHVLNIVWKSKHIYWLTCIYSYGDFHKKLLLPLVSILYHYCSKSYKPAFKIEPVYFCSMPSALELYRFTSKNISSLFQGLIISELFGLSLTNKLH